MKAVRFVAWLLVAVGGAISCVGLWWVVDQQLLLARIQSTQAEILSADVQRLETRDSKGRRKVSYFPAVSFRYRVGADTYQGSRLYLDVVKGSEAWAYGVVAPYHAGMQVTAWYDPERPERAFLLRQYVFERYGLMLFPGLGWGIGVLMLLGAGVGLGSPPRPQARGEGLYELASAASAIDRRTAVQVAGCLWGAFGAAGLGHYFRMAAPHWTTAAWIAAGLYAILVLACAGMALYYHRLLGGIGEARLYVGADRFVLGDRITAVAEHHPGRVLKLAGAELGLVLEEQRQEGRGKHRHTVTEVLWSERRKQPGLEGALAEPGSTLRLREEFELPRSDPEGPPVRATGSSGSTSWRWFLELRTRVDDEPDFRGRYPLRVAPEAPTRPPAGSPRPAR